jgi:cysteine-rich repeat protein
LVHSFEELRQLKATIKSVKKIQVERVKPSQSGKPTAFCYSCLYAKVPSFLRGHRMHKPIVTGRYIALLLFVFTMSCGEQVVVREVEVECGNEQTETGEACDDGNDVNTDGCTNGCEVAICGDGTTRADLNAGDEGFEACDDGNDDDNDACTNLCTVASCGDAVLGSDVSEGGLGFESCDDGNQTDTDACPNDCTEARCGDGILRADLGRDDSVFETCWISVRSDLICVF